MEDRDLIAACIAGDEHAWQQVTDKYLRLVYHVVRKTLNPYSKSVSEQDVEDISSEFFHSLVRDDYRLLKSIGEPYDLKAWLAISGRRKAIDFIRKRKLSAISLDDQLSSGSGDGRVLDVLAAPDPHADDLEGPGRKADLLRLMGEALKDLNPKERLIIQLFYFKGKKYREIAEILRIPLNSVGPMLVRAMGKLGGRLRERTPQ